MGRNFMAASMLSVLAMSSGALGVLQMNVKRVAPVNANNLRSRSTITSSIANNITEGSYMISTEVGTPGQAISLVLDTGSSDVWVLSKTANQCNSAKLEAEYGYCVGGTYDSTASSTYKLVNTNFDISYEDGTGSKGDYMDETFAVGNGTLTSLQMGLAINTTTGVGIMGIGYDTDEASTTTYPSVIDQMVTQGLIPTKAYSLYLDDLQASSGSILFGGIDTAKYTGSLITVPIEKDSSSGTYTSFTVALTTVGVTSAAGKNTTFSASTLPAAVVLDSGTTLTYLPDIVAAKIYAAVGAVDQSVNATQDGNVLIDCNVATETELTINYGFGGTGGPQISVGINELVFPLDGSSVSGSPFTSTCIFGIYPAGDTSTTAAADVVFLLGDTFLRSAYVVYDISSNQVAMAPSSFNQTGSNIQAFSASASSIPNASGVASAVTVVQSATSLAGVGGTSATAASSSKAAAAGPLPAFQLGGLFVLSISGLMAVVGGTWFLV